MFQLRKGNNRRNSKQESQVCLLRRQDAVQEKKHNNQSQSKMNYKVSFEIENPALLKLLKTEYRNVEKERFKVTADKNIKVEAKDATALKAALNSVANAIAVFEKMENIK